MRVRGVAYAKHVNKALDISYFIHALVPVHDLFCLYSRNVSAEK